MKDLFASKEGLIYLNSGSHSRTPFAVLAALQGYQREYENNPTAALFAATERLWRVQQKLAAFFNARPQDLFLSPNVTQPLNTFILNSPLAPSSEIALSELEYGAVANTVRFRAERDGLAVKVLRVPAAPDEYASLTRIELAERIISQLTPSTRMLVLSQITTGTGIVLPILEIARHTRRHGILLVVDGAHTPGSISLDSTQFDDVDFFGGNLHKWMMGPKGTAFAWVHPDRQSLVTPTHPGWTTFEWPPPFRQFAPGHEFARKMLMTGCFDFAPYFALEDCLNFWKQHGTKTLQDTLLNLQERVIHEVSEGLAWKMISPRPSALVPGEAISRGPLLTFEFPEAFQSEDPLALMQRILTEHGLQILVTQVRGRNALRMSPHVYNSGDEIGRAIAILSDLRAIK